MKISCVFRPPLGACLAAALLVQVTPAVRAAGAAEPPKPTSATTRQLEGWTVRVDDRLLAPPNDALGTKALRFLENKLADIRAVVAPGPLAKLQGVTIVLDLTHGKLRSMQYHPDAGWLRENGYATNLVKCVHIPEAADLATPRNITEQPWVILHELAHAYHDQVLDFDDPRILQAYERFKKSGHGDAALLFDGTRVRHYGLTDQKEFFAEMTEAYFGVDDFFPFNRAELITAEPEIHELMQAIWGPVAGRTARPAKGAGHTQLKSLRPDEAATVLWYAQPAAKWAEALPVGNGRLGAMVFGGTDTERLQLNEQTLWTGGPYDPTLPGGPKALPEIRRLVFAGKYFEAEALFAKAVMGKPDQMNYWPAEVTGLPECVEPLVQMVKELSETGARVAKIHYGARGWVFHQNTDQWRAAAPMDGPTWGTFSVGGAWLCTHLWEHYRFTGDKEYLREVYPLLKGAAQFFLDTLVEQPEKKWLVTYPSTSPENFPAWFGNHTYHDAYTGINLPGTTICAGSTKWTGN
jgi:hypothetical protein